MVALVVDDDPVSRLVAEYILRGGGYEVVSAGSAEEATEVVRDGTHAIDIVVCDYLMPGANGLDLLEQLTSAEDIECPPFVLLTGVSSSEELDDARSSLVSAYLTKPVQSTELLEVVESLTA